MASSYLSQCKYPFFLNFRCVQEKDVACECTTNGVDSVENETQALFLPQAHEEGWNRQRSKPGMIRSIFCENFMGHRQLHIELCRNVNVISDPDSVSTLFTAIQVALGANASQLGIVNHLRELVTTPTDTNSTGPGTIARVCITLENSGENGFARHMYGDEIQIERYLSSRAGCYGFKVLDVDGVEHSRSKSDVFAMLNHLNIGVDNPAAILKLARAECVGDPKELYRFFASATKVDMLLHTFDAISEEVDRYRTVRDRLLESQKEKEEEADLMKSKYDQERDNFMLALFASSKVANRSAVDVNKAFDEAMQMLDSVRYNFAKLGDLEATQSELSKAYLRAKVGLEVNQNMIDTLNKEIERLQDELRTRKKRLMKEHNYLVTLASVCFDECLQTMGYRGGMLKVDYDKRELVLTVHKKKQCVNIGIEPHEGIAHSRKMEDEIKSMAFLFSISETLGYPIQCSSIHPKHCLGLLEKIVSCCSIFSNRQFILVTPIDIPASLKEDKKVKIIRF